MTSEALMETWRGSEQLWWLGIYKPGNGVWSRPHSKLHAQVMISVPDVAIMQSSTPDKVQRWVSHPSISLWKQLVGSGKHLIISDAKQLKTQHLLTYGTHTPAELLTLIWWPFGYSNTSNIALMSKNLFCFFMNENRRLRFDAKRCIHQGALPLDKETFSSALMTSISYAVPSQPGQGKNSIISHRSMSDYFIVSFVNLAWTFAPNIAPPFLTVLQHYR